MSGRNIVLALCGLAALASGQTFSTGFAGAFVDISTTGGTAITGALDDSEHNIVTTVGNALFPAGNVRIGNNGAVAAGITTGEINFANVAVAATGIPTGLPTGAAAYLCPLWDDYVPPTSTAATTIWWQETGGVLYVMWLNEDHYNTNVLPAPGTTNQGFAVTFEIQVFGAPAACSPVIQYLYNDTVFGGAAAPFDNGVSATIGYVKGSLAGVANAQHSFNTVSVGAGSVLSILSTTFSLVPSSPGGSGWLQIDLVGGPCGGGAYVLAATLNAGVYPNGWLYGVDIPYAELIGEFNTGYPFVGPLSAAGAATIGPFSGTPPVTFYAVGLGFPIGGSGVPTLHTAPVTYTVP